MNRAGSGLVSVGEVEDDADDERNEVDDDDAVEETDETNAPLSSSERADDADVDEAADDDDNCATRPRAEFSMNRPGGRNMVFTFIVGRQRRLRMGFVLSRRVSEVVVTLNKVSCEEAVAKAARRDVTNEREGIGTGGETAAVP